MKPKNLALLYIFTDRLLILNVIFVSFRCEYIATVLSRDIFNPQLGLSQLSWLKLDQRSPHYSHKIQEKTNVAEFC